MPRQARVNAIRLTRPPSGHIAGKNTRNLECGPEGESETGRDERGETLPAMSAVGDALAGEDFLASLHDDTLIAVSPVDLSRGGEYAADPGLLVEGMEALGDYATANAGPHGGAGNDIIHGGLNSDCLVRQDEAIVDCIRDTGMDFSLGDGAALCDTMLNVGLDAGNGEIVLAVPTDDDVEQTVVVPF